MYANTKQYLEFFDVIKLESANRSGELLFCLRLVAMSSDKQMLLLGTLPGRSLIAGRRVRWNDVFATPFVESEFRANAEAFGVDQYPSNVLWGVAEVKLVRRHSPIDVLTKYESAQLRGWCSAFDTMDSRSLARELVFFQVLNIWL